MCICRWGLNYSGESYHNVFTVWYTCTPVACDSRYILSTVPNRTPRVAAVLYRGLSIVIIILPAFSPIQKMFLLHRLFLLCLSTALLPLVVVAYVYGIC